MRKCQDWIASYLDYTQVTESPEIFHLWSAISCLAATTGRNCRLNRGAYVIYPNHYIILVAPSSVAKKSTAVGIARKLLEEAKVVKMLASRITNAAVLLKLSDAAKETGRSECLVFASELATFLSKEETHRGLITTLNDLYDSPDQFINELKTGPSDILKEICLNMLAATTPTDIGELFPRSSTGTGFMPRLHMIYSKEGKGRIPTPSLPAELGKNLVEDLIHIKSLKGEVQITEDGEEFWQDWYRNMKYPDLPILDSWYGRKHDHMLKLAILLSLSCRDDLVLNPSIIGMAIQILDQMEQFLPLIYNEIGKLPITEHKERILKQMERRKGVATRSELLHDNWHCLDAENMDKVIATLLQQELICQELQGKRVVYKLAKGEKK